ncbi:hypothetical protein TWF696_008074 [Orbilia brochopaga]|uniref:Uncharacterized protein n=1 Tax=Orbilia brochopaga TaxID=3140254 RepID=A0AAV9UQF8_9PEZI
MDDPRYYPYYNSVNQLPLGALPYDDCHAAADTVRALLESPRVQRILSRLIAGPEPEPTRAEWHIRLVEPPDPPEAAISTYTEELHQLDLTTLPVDSKILQEYQSADPDCAYTYKRYRLLEIACAAIHFLAIRLYQKYHPRPLFQEPSSGHGIVIPYPRIWHPDYFKYSPTGHPPAVGFWAEAQIFGGIIYFDRGSGEECTAVWLHGRPGHRTKEVYKLPEDAVLGVFEGKTLPLEASWENLECLSVAEAQERGIYREFGLAHTRVYYNFLTICQRPTVEEVELMRRKYAEMWKRQAEDRDK